MTCRRGDGVPADASPGPDAVDATLHTNHGRVWGPSDRFDGNAPRRWTGVMFNAYYNFLLEFSYWPIFSQQVYSFIVGMYFLDIFIAMGLESMLCESLLIAPIDVCINVIENTMTMGAASFVDFMVSFMVGLSITMIDRLYLGPAVDTVTTLIPRC